MKFKRAAGLFTIAAGLVVAIAAAHLVPAAPAVAQDKANTAKWTRDNQLVLPKGWREWVFLGAPLTPNALNGGAAGFPEYHNTYIDPKSHAAFKRTGKFPEGTVIFKELQLTLPGDDANGSRAEVSGRGYFPGAFNGADVAVKDSKRCADTNNWCYFNFGHKAEPYAAKAPIMPKDKCAFCHIANATDDMVFTKFYRLLRKSK